MEQEALLSIIMPCYNMADTLSRALDSILMQQTDFLYEILLVDDCSTDNTGKIAQMYADKHKHIYLISHQENRGNAWSFYDGLCAAKGDFFCVLDGDDYYTHREKLQRQIDFFRTDVLIDYVAAVHYYIYDLCDGNLYLDKRPQFTEFTYVDFITQNAGYYHTSTYMYRNIFKNNVPEFFKEKEFRGDTPRTQFHLQTSRKKVKILDFVGSAYAYTYKGIWSGMDLVRQKEYQINMLKNLKNMTNTIFEMDSYDKRILYTEKNMDGSDGFRNYTPLDTDYCLNQLKTYTSILAFHQKDYMLENFYYSEYVDSLCASLGYFNGIYHPECIQRNVNANHIAIIIGILSPQGGGIFREILELIELYEKYEIMVLVTNMTDDEVPERARVLLGEYFNVRIKAVPSTNTEKLIWLSRAMADFAPFKAYYYASHYDPYAQTLMQTGICKNVCLFSFDHGFICGISNPNLDCIIAKRPLDYLMLRKRLGKKVIYIPTWSMGIKDCDGLQYQPFNDHDNLITASGAARFYKLNDKPPFSYIDNILELVNRTKGKHYHFGPVPQEKLDYIRSYLDERELPQEAFVHIEWSDNLPQDMLKYHVDIFIEPFPVISYKITLEVLSAGIPIIAQESIRRMGKLDFIYPGNLLWKSRQDFLDTLSTLTKEQLAEHSKLSLEYFQSTHSNEVIFPYLLEEKSFPFSSIEEAVDGEMLEIRPYEKIFGDKGRLNIPVQREKEIQELLQAQREKEIQELQRRIRDDFILIYTIPISEYIEIIKQNIYDIVFIDEDKNGSVIMKCGIKDPQVYMPLEGVIEKPSGTPYIKLTYINSEKGCLQIYYNLGDGLNEKNSSRHLIDVNNEETTIALPIANWQEEEKLIGIRIDPPDGTKFGLINVKIGYLP